MLPDELIFTDCFILAICPHQELCKLLPEPDVGGIERHNLFIILDRPVQLALGDEPLCAFKEFVFL